MRYVTFKSNSGKKIDLLIEVAKEMGIKYSEEGELTDEEMALPGPPPSKDQLEAWLAKEDGPAYPAEESFDRIKKDLAQWRKQKK